MYQWHHPVLHARPASATRNPKGALGAWSTHASSTGAAARAKALLPAAKSTLAANQGATVRRKPTAVCAKSTTFQGPESHY